MVRIVGTKTLFSGSVLFVLLDGWSLRSSFKENFSKFKSTFYLLYYFVKPVSTTYSLGKKMRSAIPCWPCRIASDRVFCVGNLQ